MYSIEQKFNRVDVVHFFPDYPVILKHDVITLASRLTLAQAIDFMGTLNRIGYTDNNDVVWGDLDLSYRVDLVELPDILIVNGDLILNGCKNLKVLPRHLRVKGGINLIGCKSLKSLPDNLTVNGSFNLGFTTFEALPKNLTVNGTLKLWGCTRLSTLPTCLKVSGSINVYGCPKLAVDTLHFGSVRSLAWD